MCGVDKELLSYNVCVCDGEGVARVQNSRIQSSTAASFRSSFLENKKAIFLFFFGKKKKN